MTGTNANCGCRSDLHPGMTHGEHLLLLEVDLTLAELERMLEWAADPAKQELVLIASRSALVKLVNLDVPPDPSPAFVAAWHERAERLRSWLARLRERLNEDR